jgi:hypothetical protein
VKSDEQGKKLLTLHTLINEPVEVVPHERFNQSEGVITCALLKDYSEEEIVDGLSHVGVQKAYRMKRKNDNGELENTTTLILTFNTCNPPDRIRIIAGLSERVRPYIPLPRRCFKCQKYGHPKKNCRNEIEICARCSEPCHENHSSNDCTGAIKCYHCKEPHLTTSKKCQRYIMEQEIIATKVKEHLSFYEARQKVLDRFPRFKIPYSRAIQYNNSNHQNNAATEIQQIKTITTANVEQPQRVLQHLEEPAPTNISAEASSNHITNYATTSTTLSPEKPALMNITDNYQSPERPRGNKRNNSSSPSKSLETHQKKPKQPTEETFATPSKVNKSYQRNDTQNIPIIRGAHRPSNHTKEWNKSTDNPHSTPNRRSESGRRDSNHPHNKSKWKAK